LAEQFGQADGQPADPVAAYMWYLVAENNAQSFNERIEAGKQRLSQTISPHDRAEAERRAAAWVRKSRRPPSSVDFDETSKQLLTCAT
jgi:hypothetical protein